MKNLRYILRQWFVVSGKNFYAISLGVMMAYPTILIPGITNVNNKNSSEIYVSKTEAYWIVTSNSIASFFGIFILTPIMQIYGRRSLQIVQSLLLLFGWITIYFATNVATLYLGRILQGLSMGSTFLNPIMLSEYTNPKSRGYLQTIVKVFGFFGVFICHLCVSLLHWRHIAVIAAFSTTISLIIVYYWPESPSWLASKGRFLECKESWNWLFGGGEKSKDEMDMVILAQQERLESKLKSNGDFLKLKKVWRKIKMRDFLKAFLITTLLTIVFEATGKHYFTAYAVQLLIELVGDKSMGMYCVITIDVVTMFGLVCSSILIRHIKRRSLLFTVGYIAVILLLIVSTMIFLRSHYGIGVNLTWLSTSIFMFYILLINIIILPICFIIISEVVPLEHKGIGIFFSGFVFIILYVTVLQFAPLMTIAIGLHGTYFVFSIVQLLSLSCLFIILPETKDRMLQDIENEFKGKNRVVQTLRDGGEECVTLNKL